MSKHSIILFSLGLGGVIFAILVGILVWFETGNRRTIQRLVIRLIVWVFSFPLFFLISMVMVMFMANLAGLPREVFPAYLKTAVLGAPIMAIIGLAGGIYSHLLPKLAALTTPPDKKENSQAE